MRSSCLHSFPTRRSSDLYFATPKSIQAFNPSFVFHWANKENEPINHWEDVVGHFLMIPMAHQMVGDYLVIDEAKDVENQKHMLLRPYQVHALQIGRASCRERESI